ncbi:NADPH:quinone reductase [Dactylosporangium sp. CA-092794]|uniref:NADPH:quinone reductase n=1 Tax=Dactylosporangium sp. CA-092794 TaxID=3239929 RepID=UPI003D8AEC1C
MRAVAYGRGGVLQQISLDRPTPRPGEVRVRVGVSGVNPADWKNRRNYAGAAPVVPHHDGGGVIDAVGDGVDPRRVGQRVWLWETGRQRRGGTAQEFTVVPHRHAVALPDGVGLELAACLGVPAVTAHRCLTIAEGGPARLAPGALSGQTVLVAGGAGAVGHAATQLARWSGANVIATVSTDEKVALAEAAGAHHVVRYRDPDVAERIRALAPGGADVIVEVAPHQNAELDAVVLAPGGAVAAYAGRAETRAVLPVGALLAVNARWQFVQAFTMPDRAKEAALDAISAALVEHALPVGAAAGLPLHRFPLERAAEAHDAVEAGVVGKVLVEIDGSLR